jgi:DNA-binding transcriptional ArsR family regulator
MMECTADMSPDLLSLVAHMFRALANPSRLGILKTLLDGPHTVGQLVELTHDRQANVSKHLRVLADADLVRRTRRGTTMVYRTADPLVDQLCSLAGMPSNVTIVHHKSTDSGQQRETPWTH